MKNLFPIIIIILFFVASAVSFCYKDWRLGLIYLLSAVLNIVFIL